MALLEPPPDGPDLVGALTELARAETLLGRYEAALRFADRALALGEELGLARSARALGYRGTTRAGLGDRGGLDDMREAIALAIQAGQGREVATLHNNLGVDLWALDGPAASLEVFRAGIAFGQARGLTEAVDAITASGLDVSVDRGGLDVVLEVAAGVTDRLEASGDIFDLVQLRAAQARALSLRGEGAQVMRSLDWLASNARRGDPALVTAGLGSSALVLAASGHHEAAAMFLAEVEATPDVRECMNYTSLLPSMVRTALALDDLTLAESLVRGVEPRYPYAEHALVAVRGALAEARGNHEAAAYSYADAADRWDQFGVVPEHAFALLGQGRCLIRLSRPTEAAAFLQHAREIFEGLQAAPALAETDALLTSAA